ncbi:uncharacterized protein [Euwallacea fornicatus]|uniref:uncharacterized protein isoform X1 n=1 Tax=Euwallacea fornicatus TaxID=995702 RepID=UPI00338E4836
MDFPSFESSEDFDFILEKNENLSFFQQILEKVLSAILKLSTQLESLFKLIADAFEGYKYQFKQKPTNVPEGHTKANSTKIQKQIEIDTPCINGLAEVVGLGRIKSELYTLVILPKSQPQLFHNRTVCNSILLYGPPGTGKTRLVHGLAADTTAVLHTLSAGKLLSSFVGETEKNIKQIFCYLRTTDSFSILFIDEIDGICRKRTSSEHDYSRRIKTELMGEMTKMTTHRNILIIAATNCPWDLDSAILRRFQRQIYVPLPNNNDRLELFQYLTKNTPILQTPKEFHELIEMCQGFSGSDIASLVQDALDIPLTELQSNNIWRKTSDGFYEPFVEINVSEMNQENIYINHLQAMPPFTVKARPVMVADFIEAAKRVQVTVRREDLIKFDTFRQGK